MQITGLAPNTTYYFEIAALNALGQGAASPTAVVKTLISKVVLCLRLSHLVVFAGVASQIASSPLSSGATRTSIDLQWSAPSYDGGSAVTQYQLQVQGSNGSSFTINTASTATSYTLTGLQPNTTYHIQVAAVNELGVSPASPAAVVTTNANAYSDRRYGLCPLDGVCRCSSVTFWPRHQQRNRYFNHTLVDFAR